MKLLFLDVDGVLNNLVILSESRSSNPLGEQHLRLLKMLVAGSGCDIVLSSTWRLFHESKLSLEVAFKEHEIPMWVGCTPELINQPRSAEILQYLEAWLQGRDLRDPVVAVGIDDDEDIDIGTGHGLPVHFKPLRTSFDNGLTAEVVQEAIDWFHSKLV